MNGWRKHISDSASRRKDGSVTDCVTCTCVDVLAHKRFWMLYVQMHCLDGVQIFVRHDFGWNTFHLLVGFIRLVSLRPKVLPHFQL